MNNCRKVLLSLIVPNMIGWGRSDQYSGTLRACFKSHEQPHVFDFDMAKKVVAGESSSTRPI
jgi:hypothetical protein